MFIHAKTLVFLFCGLLRIGASEGLLPSTPLTEVGSLCEDTIALSVPTDGSPKIVTGTHSKLFSFFDCDYVEAGPVPATIYQIEGKGTMLEAALLAHPQGSLSEIGVFEGCPSELGSTAGVDLYPNCVAGQYYQGARWMAKAGQLYTIVVYSLMDPSSSDFILRVETAEADSICSAEGETAGSLVDLGKLNTTTGTLQQMGGPEDSVLITDLPFCDYEPQSSSVLYKFIVPEPNVSVVVQVEGGDGVSDAYVTVYQGDCESGYSCLAPTNAGDENSLMSNATLDNETDSTIRASYNVHSFHNEKAGTAYIVAVNSCCNADITDFRLTVNVSNYGNVCEDSAEVDLSSGEYSAVVSLSGKRVYRDLYSCQVSIDDSYDEIAQSTPSESANLISGPTAFYKIDGDGKTYVAYVAPSDRDVQDNGQLRMAVFSATSCSATFQCMKQDNFNSFVSIETEIGETYYLAIYDEIADNKGSYDLQITAVSVTSLCEDATDLGTVNSTELTVRGTSAKAGYYTTLDFCNVYGESVHSRVFSFVAESDGPIMASVKADPTVDFYPQVAVVPNCSGENCIDVALSEGDMMSPRAIWTAESGTTYYVIVFTFDMYNTGQFDLTLEPLTTTPICDNENVVDLGTIPDEGAMFEGSTISQPLFSVASSCHEDGGYFSELTRGATFSLSGDGNAYVVGFSAIDFSPMMTVFNGGCDTFECIPTASAGTYLLDTKAGETYTILVGDCCSAGGSGGTFNLHVNKVAKGNVTADIVEKIESIGNETKKVLGSTTDGLFYPTLPACYFPVDSPAVVYELNTGVGYFSAQVSGFGFSAYLALYKADGSGGFECYGTQGPQEVSWEGEEAKSLYLVVFGSANEVGDFSLRLNKHPISGEPCDDVYDLGNVTEDGLVHVETLDGWSFLPENQTACEYEGHRTVPGGRSKIYTVIGNGKTLVASTFISQMTRNQGISVSVTVVKGVCGAVECVEGAYSNSSSFWSLTWPSVAGETYDIVVSTCCSFDDAPFTEDDFVLMVYEEGTKLFSYPIEPSDDPPSDVSASDGTDSLENSAANGIDSALDADSSSRQAVNGMSFWAVMTFICYFAL
ncbi:hypothetical protein FisN_26Hh051 [Fistulifera solaris]|uniref:Uncharacterized protein n=1 Tax=Fistulifera solaris TaxID=1519565 RepID=A0A1Z5JXZ3_FISSO|nr:hypothetical protein FisN_26Hh051 [Fistulifera solaris]|eukprot:GAX18756.1 hypothetical protein FisN_26Hh051 [Fistulifera solaris]